MLYLTNKDINNKKSSWSICRKRIYKKIVMAFFAFLKILFQEEENVVIEKNKKKNNKHEEYLRRKVNLLFEF